MLDLPYLPSPRSLVCPLLGERATPLIAGLGIFPCKTATTLPALLQAFFMWKNKYQTKIKPPRHFFSDTVLLLASCGLSADHPSSQKSTFWRKLDSDAVIAISKTRINGG